MAKKKPTKPLDDNASKVDLSNLFDAARSSLNQFEETPAQEEIQTSAEEVAFNGNSGAGAEVAEIFDPEQIQEIQESMEQLDEVHEAASSEAEQDETDESLFESPETEDLEELAEAHEDSTHTLEEALGLSAESELEASEPGGHGEEESEALESKDLSADLEGTELEGFDSASIEEIEFVEDSQLESVIESVLFATDRPVSLASLKQIFKGTNVTNSRLKRALEALQVEYAGGRRGVTLEEVGSGYQLRTKIDNIEFMRRSFKAKSFKLSGPALEVLAIVAYKQPVVKAEIDEIRGVESGHLLRALMEKNLVLFAGKSDLPGKPMQYGTTRKFLEIFGLRNLKELPTLSQIDELLPEGIGDEEQKPKLADITEGLSEKAGQSYSEGEEELLKISDQLEKIDTSSEFFEKEKLRQKQERDAEKARNLKEALAVGEPVSNRDINWLKRYEEQLALEQGQTPSEKAEEGTPGENQVSVSATDESAELEAALQAWDSEVENEVEERLEANDIADIDEEVM